MKGTKKGRKSFPKYKYNTNKKYISNEYNRCAYTIQKKKKNGIYKIV